MGEPIKLYDSNGEAVIVYSPSTAADLIAAGYVTALPPVEMPPETVTELMEITVLGQTEREYMAVPVRKRKRAERGNVL